MMSTEALLAANPFPGLRPFTSGEGDRFFGRQRQIDELVQRLDQVPFLAVAGASGCGKSSLVLAGLLNALAQRHASQGGVDWRPVVMRPGNRPIAELAERLAAALAGSGVADPMRAASLEGRLRLGGLALVEAVRTARLAPQQRVLVVVDQFEEIFRFKQMTDPEEAAAFIKLLLNAAHDPQSPLSVVLTMRSEALGQCAEFRDLPEAVNRGQYLVPRLTREQRKDAIVKPIEWRGQQIAPRLVQRLLNDVSDDFDDLPVMQHVLTRIWRHWAQACGGSRAIDLVDNEAVGGAAKALSNHADEAFHSLGPLQPLAERVFRALTERLPEGAAIRRPLAFELLCAVVAAPREDVAKVVERFRRADTAFLMPPPAVPLATNPVIDISHESLIRLWGQLRGWAQAEAEARAALLRLVQTAQAWQQGDGDLWRGRDLERAIEWQQKLKPNAAWVGLSTGTDGSVTWSAAQKFLAESDRSARRERRRWQVLVWGLRGLALLTVAVSVGAWLNAVALQKQATSRELASRALLEIDQDPARSAHLALAAMERDPANPGAEFALRQSLATLEVAHATRIVEVGEPIVDVRYGHDGSHLVVASERKARIFDAKTLAPIGAPIAFDDDLMRAWLIASDQLLLVQMVGVTQVRRLNGDPVQTLACPGENNTVYSIAVSPDARQLALGCRNGEIARWEASGADLRASGVLAAPGSEGYTVIALAFSPDGVHLASGDTSGAAHIWKTGDPKPWSLGGAATDKDSAPKHTHAIRDITFHPTDPEFLATASDDHQAVVWKLDLEQRRVARATQAAPTRWALLHDRAVTAVRFAPRGDKSPLLTVSDKRLRLWEDESSREARGHDDWVTDANPSDDGEFLVSASGDGTARVWSTRYARPVAVLRGHRSGVTRALFVPGQRQVITASRDGSLRLWELRPPLTLIAEARWLLSAAFDPSGQRVAACGEVWGPNHDRAHCRLLAPRDLSEQTEAAMALPGTGRADMVSSLGWSADGKLLMGSNDTQDVFRSRRPSLWNSESRRDITPAWLKEWPAATFSPSRPELLTVRDDGSMALWDNTALSQDAPTPKRRWGPRAGRWEAVLSPDGRSIATIEAGGAALLRADEPSVPARRLLGHRGDVRNARFSADSRWLVTTSTDRSAIVWRVEPSTDGVRGERDKIELAGGHTAAVSSASFSPDGTQVATSGADNSIQLWDARNGNRLAVLRWHGDAVNDVRFSPDGRSILSASDDGTVKLGQCRVCALPVEQLRERALQEALLTRDDADKLRAESHVSMPWFRLPALWFAKPKEKPAG